MKTSVTRGLFAVFLATAFVSPSQAQIQVSHANRTVTQSFFVGDVYGDYYQPADQAYPSGGAGFNGVGLFSKTFQRAQSFLPWVQASSTVSQSTTLTHSPDYLQFRGTLHLHINQTIGDSPDAQYAGSPEVKPLTEAQIIVHIKKPVRYTLTGSATHTLVSQSHQSSLNFFGGSMDPVFIGDATYVSDGPPTVNVRGTLAPGQYTLDASVLDNWVHGSPDANHTTLDDVRTVRFFLEISDLPDASSDYVLYNPNPLSQATEIWTMNNNRVASKTTGETIEAGYQLVAVADVNHDGYPDHVLYNPTTGQTKVSYLGAAPTSADGPILPTGWSLVALADFNGDGQLDYLLSDNSTPRNTAVWYMNNNTYVSSVNGPTLPVGWSLVGAGDFNSDLQPDYVLFNSSSGQTAVWYLNGVTYTAAANVKKASAGWALQGVADFDHNGQLDFVLSKPTGQTAIWYLNGVTFLRSAAGPTLTAGYNLVSP